MLSGHSVSFKQCLIKSLSFVGSMLSTTCSVCFGMSLCRSDVMGGLLLNECFSSAAFHAWMVKGFCLGVPFGLGTGFCCGVLILMSLEVSECLGFLVGAVRTGFPSSAWRFGARLSV